VSHQQYAKTFLSTLFLIALFGLASYTVVAGYATAEDKPVQGVEITQLAKGVTQYRTQHGAEVCYTVVGKLHGWTVSNSCFQQQMTMEDVNQWLK
jgi:hypothetical protein